MISYQWTFPAFDVAKSQDGLIDVVTSIHWVYTATEDDFSAFFYGQAVLAAPDPDSFVPFADITKAWSIEQVSALLDVEALEQALADRIEALKNPTVVPMAPPFDA